MRASHEWDDLLAAGMGVVAAAEAVEALHPGLDPAFYDYLRR